MRPSLLLALALSCTSPGFLAASAAAESRRPNLIMIMADDFGYECVTANGGESYRTPHLDRLAREGVRFDQCHVQPLCTPTRVQLMTGKYNIRNYVNFGTLRKEERTFGNILRDAGYVTAICGKWQLGHDVDLPRHFGFDESYLWQHTRRPLRYINPGLEHNGKEIDFKNGEYGPDLVNQFAIDFISKNRAKPFFLYYPLMLTHSPYQPTPDSDDWDPKIRTEKEGTDPKHFADMTEYMDKLIGRLIAKLDELQLRDNTLVLFIGDNGTGKGTKSRFRGQEYVGGKGTTTEAGTHVPCIASWPAQMKKGQVVNDLVSSTDFLPTLCEAAGVAVPSNIDGVSVLPQIRGESGHPRPWLYHWYSPRQGTDKAIREFAFDHRYKLYGNGEFYDLTTDRFEKQSLAPESLDAKAKKSRAKLQAALDQFRHARPAELEDASSATTDQSDSKVNRKAKRKLNADAFDVLAGPACRS